MSKSVYEEPPPAKPPGQYRNRIIGHGEEDPESLASNPKNWRIHPRAQEGALAGLLTEVGWVDTVLVNQRSGFVVDGHLRVAHAISKNEPLVPVTYVDLDEDEEALVLAALDPIAMLASTDSAQLHQLLSEISTQEAGLQRLLDDMRASSPRFDSATEELKLSPDELREIYESGAQRQIYLLFSAEEYAEVIRQFGQVMEQHPELETNVDVVKYLLADAVREQEIAGYR
jgi:hypothetical protein